MSTNDNGNSRAIHEIVGSIGSKVRALRLQRGLSLQQLAGRADVSPATIHKIEHAEMTPSVTTLLKLAGAFNRPLGYFVDEGAGGGPAVLTPAEGRRPMFTSHARIDLAGISGPYGRFFLAGAVATVEPGASSGPKPMDHPGEELVFVLNGRLEFEVEGRTYVLGAEDALHFGTDRSHRWRNPAPTPARALWMALRPL
jgi:transcriptional regulator with XRE-family HTH domain